MMLNFFAQFIGTLIFVSIITRGILFVGLFLGYKIFNK